ncbi:MAG: metallophosphoesterase [Candidatus Heimdallarchaeota archaeon]|nr:metallophosphoesterase [Candidatus Heimdallarchaeota archaeon]
MSKDLLHLMDEIYIVSGTPFLMINELKENKKYLVCSDLHLGIETETRVDSAQVSQASLSFFTLLRALVLDLKITDLVINGDIKHHTHSVTLQELEELEELFRIVGTLSVKLHLIKGNHDLLLDPILTRYNQFMQDSLELHRNEKRIFITHGDVDVNENQGDILIIGHEHPSYELRSGSLGIKLPAFVLCEGDSTILILPAANPISTGKNLPRHQSTFLSPILRNRGIHTMQCYPFDTETGILPVPRFDFSKFALTFQKSDK